MRSSSFVLLAALLSSGCFATKQSARTTSTRASSRTTRAGNDAPPVSRDPELEIRAARLDLQLLEKEALIEDLQTRLDDAQAEVVRAMAKLRSAASRAEAASGMAEAEVALQSLRANGGAAGAETARVSLFLRRSAVEFDKQNYGGALYLADQAKALAVSFRGHAEVSRAGSRAGETRFALPIRIKAATRGNVREGPGTSFDVAFAVEGGTPLTGLSYTDEWVRVTDDRGRSGWIYLTLVTRP